MLQTWRCVVRLAANATSLLLHQLIPIPYGWGRKCCTLTYPQEDVKFCWKLVWLWWFRMVSINPKRWVFAEHPVNALKGKCRHLRGLPLQTIDHAKPVLLTGSDHLHRPAVRTCLGWTLQGPAQALIHRLTDQQCYFTSRKGKAMLSNLNLELKKPQLAGIFHTTWCSTMAKVELFLTAPSNSRALMTFFSLDPCWCNLFWRCC